MRHYVNSTAILWVEYVPLTQRMWVMFRDGDKAYEFCGVPLGVFERFLGAASKGKFYDQFIKDKYDCF